MTEANKAYIIAITSYNHNIDMQEEYIVNAEFTPDIISKLGEKEVFVFGSNLAGLHLGGAARTAAAQFHERIIGRCIKESRLI